MQANTLHSGRNHCMNLHQIFWHYLTRILIFWYHQSDQQLKHIHKYSTNTQCKLIIVYFPMFAAYSAYNTELNKTKSKNQFKA